MKDCRECSNSQYSRGTYLCLAFGTPKPTSWMRDDRNECTTLAVMFEPKDKKYSEFE